MCFSSIKIRVLSQGAFLTGRAQLQEPPTPG
jgi:hypothetical protein